MFRRLLAFVLLLQFGWYITPKEIWHTLSSHHDTEHALSGHNLLISAEHHHCELLKADQQFHSLYAFTPAFTFEAPPTAPLPQPMARYATPLGIGLQAIRCLRGPPVA